MAQALHGSLGARAFPHPTLFWTLQEGSVGAPLLLNLSPTSHSHVCLCCNPFLFNSCSCFIHLFIYSSI